MSADMVSYCMTVESQAYSLLDLKLIPSMLNYYYQIQIRLIVVVKEKKKNFTQVRMIMSE